MTGPSPGFEHFRMSRSRIDTGFFFPTTEPWILTWQTTAKGTHNNGEVKKGKERSNRVLCCWRSWTQLFAPMAVRCAGCQVPAGVSIKRRMASGSGVMTSSMKKVKKAEQLLQLWGWDPTLRLPVSCTYGSLLPPRVFLPVLLLKLSFSCLCGSMFVVRLSHQSHLCVFVCVSWRPRSSRWSLLVPPGDKCASPTHSSCLHPGLFTCHHDTDGIPLTRKDSQRTAECGRAEKGS